MLTLLKNIHPMHYKICHSFTKENFNNQYYEDFVPNLSIRMKIVT